MKFKPYRVAFFMLLIFSGINSNAQKLEVTISGLKDQMVVLADFYGERNRGIDSVKTDTSGLAVFDISEVNKPGLYRLFLKKEQFIDIIINEDNIKLETNAQAPMKDLEILESEENELFYEFMRRNQQFHQKLELLTPLVDYYPESDTFYYDVRRKFIAIQLDQWQYIDSLQENYPDTYASRLIGVEKTPKIDPDMSNQERMEYLRAHYFDHVDFTDLSLLNSDAFVNKAISYLSLYSNRNFDQEQLENAFKTAVDTIMVHAMDSEIVYEFMLDYLIGGFEKYHFDRVLEYIAENYTGSTCENEERKSDLQTRLAKYKELADGKTAPDIEMTCMEGNKVKLSKLDSDYKLVLFWATWCPHCKDALPEIHDIYKNQEDKKLEVIAISLDEDQDEWNTFINEGDYQWLNCSDLKKWDSQPALDYNVYATPSMFLLDKDNTILAKPVSVRELKRDLAEIGLL